ncbi:hypothetical protein ARMGADRAFT_219497 [Armillaria gallica]|uniref:Uncharacterized protein n=1 Tax=Armillaria gallica TaxID=47427 RepID=A0A2H3DQC8_ARMGA|nr:hypothetical protein ARMGADRAFT_219497 [Armillaria gallica]
MAGQCAPDIAAVIDGPTWPSFHAVTFTVLPLLHSLISLIRLRNAGSREYLQSDESLRCTWTRCFDSIREALGGVIGEHCGRRDEGRFGPDHVLV